MKDVLCFLNEHDFIDKIDYDQIEKLRCVKQRLVIEFEECNTSNLTDALNIIDELYIVNIVHNLDALLEKTNSLWEVIFYLISFKHFVDTNEHVIEH